MCIDIVLVSNVSQCGDYCCISVVKVVVVSIHSSTLMNGSAVTLVVANKESCSLQYVKD